MKKIKITAGSIVIWMSSILLTIIVSIIFKCNRSLYADVKAEITYISPSCETNKKQCEVYVNYEYEGKTYENMGYYSYSSRMQEGDKITINVFKDAPGITEPSHTYIYVILLIVGIAAFVSTTIPFIIYYVQIGKEDKRLTKIIKEYESFENSKLFNPEKGWHQYSFKEIGNDWALFDERNSIVYEINKIDNKTYLFKDIENLNPSIFEITYKKHIKPNKDHPEWTNLGLKLFLNDTYILNFLDKKGYNFFTLKDGDKTSIYIKRHNENIGIIHIDNYINLEIFTDSEDVSVISMICFAITTNF